MNFSFTSKKILDQLFYTKEINMNVAEALNAICFDTKFNFYESFKNNNFNAIDVISAYLDLDEENAENKTILENWIKPNICLCDDALYISNPYYKTFKNIRISNEKYALQTISYPKYSFFPLDEIMVDSSNYYLERSQIGYFDHEYKYLALVENNNIWMCITPNEINTMQPYINEAKGKILTYGLGLGYFQYMCSLKDSVTDITIVENNKNIVNLFINNLLPKFEHKEKIHIIIDDALKHASKLNINYDYIFVDIWHNPEDGLPSYIYFNNILSKYNTHYWLEESMIAMFRRCVLTVTEEQLHGSNDSNYKIAYNEMDKIINNIYFKTKSKTFNNEKEIMQYLTFENLKKLAK